MFQFTIYALTLMAALGGASADKDSSRNLRAQEGLLREGAPPDILLGVAGTFAILSESGNTDDPPYFIIGNVGTSPITGAALLLACTSVNGGIYTVDAEGPACKTIDATMLTTAIGDMKTAYTQATGVGGDPDFLNLGAGNIDGKIFLPGVYKWGSSVVIPADIYIKGSSSEKWIFQIDGTLFQSSGVRIHLLDGALAKNIVWQVADAVTLGTSSHFEGIVLGQTGINLQTEASLNGRLLAQTAVTLQMNTIVQPA